MRKINLVLYLVITALIAAAAAAEVPEEDPFYSVGSDFLVIKYQDIAPQVQVLFNNTAIFLDNENDGTWDYKFEGNAGNVVTIDPGGVAVANPGALIHSDKPIGYIQQLQDTSNYDSELYTVGVPINNLKSEYFTYGSYADWTYNVGKYNGLWYVIAPKETNISIDINLDGTIDQTITVSPGTSRSFTADPFAKVYSDKPFLVYNRLTIAAIKSLEFFSPWEKVMILVTEDNTEIKIDLNNDDSYDQTLTLSKGLYIYTFTQGAHIVGNKPIALFDNYEAILSSCGSSSDFCLRRMYVSVNTFPNNIGSDIWGGSSGSYKYIVGLYNDYSGLYYNTTYFIDRQSQNDLILDYTGTINSNIITSTPSYGQIHLWSNMPLLYSFRYYPYSSSPYRQYYTPSYPYSVIYSTSWPQNKIIGTNEVTRISTRIFNPFAATTINGLEIKVKISNQFIALPTRLVLVTKKSLVDDEILDSELVTDKNPLLIDGYYEFTLSDSDSAVIDSLSPLEYLDVEYDVISPSSYGNYDLPTELTYSAPTWQK